MQSFVRVEVNPGEVRELGPGDFIGRIWKAALQVDDPLVSEAHCMVSLREGVLKLIGLRGRLVVQGRQASEVALQPGLEVALSPQTTLRVLEVSVPPALFALEHPELGRRPLTGVASLVRAPRLELTAGPHPDALAVLWSDGLVWRARLRDGRDLELVPGRPLVVDALELGVSLVSLGRSGEVTTVDPERLESPLHLVARYDTVHIHREGAPSLALDGQVARIVSELVAAEVPVGWRVLADELWPGEQDVAVLRRNWDAAMARLRKKLREGRIRLDLVRSDRGGNFELFLKKGDRVEDQT